MLALDVTSDASVEAVVGEVLRRSGRIDLLVNNAGLGVGLAGDEESSVAQAQAIFDTNFFGTVRMTRAVVPHMRRQGAGRILNMGSGLGILPMPYMAIYSASKHALEGYSESLDHELRTRGFASSSSSPASRRPRSTRTCSSPTRRSRSTGDPRRPQQAVRGGRRRG
jgi:NAD(P)-dependent dehydrogenase (short-subunit alcohol dehydrogenase family)